MSRPVEQAPCAQLDDAALVRRIMAASPITDGQAEAELYRRLAPRVRLYGLRHLRSAAAAADLVQDVLVMTVQRLRARGIREPEHLASFVLGACRQMVIDRRRGQGRRERILRTFADDVPIAEAYRAPPLDVGRLQQCLELLSERERTVLIMSFYDERQAAEIAQEIGVSPANVRVIRHRGIDRLRACLGWEGPEGSRGARA